MASVAFLRLTWAVFLKLLFPIRRAAPNIQQKLQNHLGLFKNKQDNHKVCLYDKPAKHKTPAVPCLGTWQLQQEGSNIHNCSLGPGASRVHHCYRPGRGGHRLGRRVLISVPTASPLLPGGNKTIKEQDALSKFYNFLLPISHQGEPSD